MKAVQFAEHGDRDVIEYGDHPDLRPGRDEVRFRVLAGALNHLDIWTRNGLPGLTLDLPHVPGSDAAGVVEEVGADVTRFEPGDRVAVTAGVHCGTCEFCRHGDPTLCKDFHIIGEHVRGVHSEEAVVPEENLVSVPDGVDPVIAAAAPLVFQTAWRMLVTRAEVRPGESVLVLGASGGVGHAAVQIADYVGSEVYATASSQEKLDYAREVGADHAIDYESEDFASAIRDRTGNRGVDVVVDHVGAATWRDSLASLARGGRLVTCGATTGGNPETDVNRIFWNQLEVIGSTMGTPGEVDDVLDLVWDGVFQPRIREVLPMSETARGHEMLEKREGFGKVVVRPDHLLSRNAGASGGRANAEDSTAEQQDSGSGADEGGGREESMDGDNESSGPMDHDGDVDGGVDEDVDGGVEGDVDGGVDGETSGESDGDGPE